MLGVALGCIGLSYDDFCRLGFPEFEAIWAAYADRRDTDFKDSWERMRLLATLSIQPHLRKGSRLTPARLLPFPWDKKRTATGKAPKLTAAQQRERMEKITAKLGDTLV